MTVDALDAYTRRYVMKTKIPENRVHMFQKARKWKNTMMNEEGLTDEEAIEWLKANGYIN